MASMITWPDWMPAPQQDSFSIQPEDRRLTTETEAGSIIRYQFDTDVNVADCTLVLNRTQANWFEAFERDVLMQGSIWFDFPLWIGGDVVWEKCRFKTRPKAGNLIGLHTTYTFSLYVSKRSNIDGRYAAIMLELGMDDFEYIYNKLHHILHVQSPGLTILPNEWRLRANG